MDDRYNYKEGLKRIKDILSSDVVIDERDILPKDGNTYDNAFYGWVSAIFVDIRNSTELFSDGDRIKVSRLVRAFTSEIIEILRKDDNLREIGIRGDCVYAIYATPTIDDVYNIADLTFWANTFMKMLNKALNIYSLPMITAGIGMATARELVVKAGKKGSGIDSRVWIGKAVVYASKLSGMANKHGNAPILFSKLAYTNFVDALEKKNSEAKSWFTKSFDLNVGEYYRANIVKTEFDKWIQGL